MGQSDVRSIITDMNVQQLIVNKKYLRNQCTKSKQFKNKLSSSTDGSFTSLAVNENFDASARRNKTVPIDQLQSAVKCF